jgi:hypothetical protein
MNTQPTEIEAKAFTMNRPSNPNPRLRVRGDPEAKCEYCKRDEHKQEECWFLYSHLQPTGPRRDGFNKGGDQ